ncbi:MAG TPA: ThiF family adenylyltransferase [Candidatus Saccharimonadales bacterium]
MKLNHSGKVFLPGQFNQQKLEELKNGNHNLEVIDLIKSRQLEELAGLKIGNESEAVEELEAKYKDQFFSGAWVHLPWRNQLVRLAEQDDFASLITNRNRELITVKEQAKLASQVVGIAGLSVGAGIAQAVARSCAPKVLKIADYDTVDTTNLNRLNTSFADVGQPKIDVLARQIFEINPYIEVQPFADGLDDNNIDAFFNGGQSLTLAIDEIDDFYMKLRIRQEARKNQVPVIMMTSLGDNVLVDVERYDTEEPQVFNGVFGDTTEQEMENILKNEDPKSLAIRLVDKKYVPIRAIESVGLIGKTLSGRPQLYTTILIDSGLSAFLLKRIVLYELPSGRYFVNMAKLFGLEDDLDAS